METASIEQIHTGLTEIKDGITRTDENITGLNTRLQSLQDDQDRIDAEFNKLRRLYLAGQSAIRNPQSATPPGLVSDEFARELGSTFILQCAKSGKLELLSQSAGTRDALLNSARQFLNIQTRAAL